MKNWYRREVRNAFQSMPLPAKSGIITEEEIRHLPEIVKKYLRLTGAVGKPKLHHVKMVFSGRIRSAPDAPWMKLRSEQYNFFEHPTRIFYIRAVRSGIPALGLHLYKNETAIMVIRLLGLFTVADARGREMDQGETVTVFNDMCCMAPGSLISKNITWEPVDELTVNARFTNGKISITATLFFNDKGELINWLSNDRYAVEGKEYRSYPWYTPISAYREINGHYLPAKAELIYKRPDGDFCYGEFALEEIEYNAG